MVTKEYAIAAAEVNKVLSYLPAYQIEKIPESLKSFLNKIEDKEVDVNIDPNVISLYHQNISHKAKEILAMIYCYYFTPLEEIADLPPEMIEDAKEVSEEIFGDKTQSQFEEEVKKGEVSLAVIPKELWYKKFISWLLRK